MYVTINTHQGLFRYTHLPFGIASGPTIFQQTMETINFQGLSSNGAVEWCIQTFKKAMKAGGSQVTTFHQRLMNFLLVYRSTSHTVTGEVPCVFFLKREVSTWFHLLWPDVKDIVMWKQATQKFQHDQHSQSRELYFGQRVRTSQKLLTKWRLDSRYCDQNTRSTLIHSTSSKWPSVALTHWSIERDARQSQEDVSKSSLDINDQAFGTVPVPTAAAPNITGTVSESKERQPPQLDVEVIN